MTPRATTTAASPAAAAFGRPRPKLVFFYAPTNGICRRVEGYLAQVLQHRANHETFVIEFVNTDDRPELAVRFGVERLPTFVVLEERRVRGRLVAPRGCVEIEEFLRPWLR